MMNLQWLGAVVAAISLVGCDNAKLPVSPGPNTRTLLEAAPKVQPARSIDDIFWDIAGDVPEFGGAYVGEMEQPIIVLTDTSRLSAVAPLVRAVFVSARDTTFLKPLRSQLGRFGFRTLVAFNRALTPKLTFAGIVTRDIDESQNRIAISVASETIVPLVWQAASAAQVPASAIVVNVRSSVTFASNLRDYQRPVPAGFRITGARECAIGINASTSGSPRTAYFVTPSHCTDVIGVVDSTVFHQPDATVFFHLLGKEVRDVRFFSPGDNPECPPLRICAYADAALVRYDVSYNDMDFGNIALTTFRSGPLSGDGSIDLVGQLFISAVDGYTALPPVPLGATVDKMGPESGWTYGTVTGTDVEVWISEGSITLLRQAVVKSRSRLGDSGAPMFQYWSSYPDAWFRGILVANDTARSESFYSTMPNIINGLNLSSFPLAYCWC